MKEHHGCSPSEEHQMLRETLRSFVRQRVEPQALEYDRKEQFNSTLFRELGKLGVLGLTVPEEFSGSGMDATATAIVHEELASSDPGFCLAYLAHTLLCANNIAVNGNNAQKSKWLPKLSTGEWIGAMGMSEPQSGTDVLGLSTVAKKEKGGYRLNGRKMWITNGCIDEQDTPCDLLLLYARTADSGSRESISTFVVEAGTPGFSVGQKIRDKAGMRASNTAEMCLDDCFISEENRVGEEGESLIHMMRNLEIERLGLAAMSVGIARRSLEAMVSYAKERTAFGKPLNSFGQIQSHISRSYAEFQAARSYLYVVASQLKLDQPGSRMDSDGVKLFAAQTGKNIADRAIQVLGGYGYVGEYVVERLWRDAKLLEIGGGTNEAHEKNISKDLAKHGLRF